LSFEKARTDENSAQAQRQPLKQLNQLILASQSPRRIDLLTKLGLDFEIVPSDKEEVIPPGLSPEEVVLAIAEQKAEDVVGQLRTRIESAEIPFLILAADTLVVFEGALLGKPANRQEAIAMLERLSGHTHMVHTAVVVFRAEKAPGSGNGGIKKSFINTVETSYVTFRPLLRSEIEAYVDTKEPMDKAGAYALQGIGAALVSKIDGSDSNVIGLPVARAVDLLRRSGMHVLGI
jgi:septum formation protein